jgi:lysophospholipase L1-like esterase
VSRGLLRTAGALLLVIGAPLLFLGFLELVAWAWGAQPLADDEFYKARDFVRSCRWDPADVRKACDPAGWKRRDDGRNLVLALGGSSVVGHPMGERRTISSFLRLQLEAARPGAYAVRSLARPCKGSFYVRQCAERALDSGPAALVVYTGHNDFSGHRGRYPELPMWMERSGWWLVEAERRLARTRFWSLLSPSGALTITPGNDPGAALGEAQAARAYRVILENTVHNLTDVIELAGERNVPVVLVTLVSNLYEFPTQRPRWDEALERASAEGLDPEPGIEDFTEGVRLYRESRFEAALAAFRRARDARPGPRAPGMLNEAIRRIAAEYPNAHLVDFERQLEAAALREGIGCNFFGTEAYCDGLHPNPRTNRMIGFAVADAVLAITNDRRYRPLENAGR